MKRNGHVMPPGEDTGLNFSTMKRSNGNLTTRDQRVGGGSREKNGESFRDVVRMGSGRVNGRRLRERWEFWNG